MNQPTRKSPALGEASDQLARDDLKSLSAKNDNKSTAHGDRRCGNCSYFDHRQECRAHAPEFFKNSEMGRWPTVFADQWCGEFVPMLDASEGGAA